jgi:TetR/AcrR family transcriptional repressor of nem operon
LSEIVSTRYENEHKARTRGRIVSAASKRMRKYGAIGTAVADAMGEAGLTHGGFYAHFKSKEELLRAAAIDARKLPSSLS